MMHRIENPNPIFRELFSSRNICGTQSLASATLLMRSHILLPSEMKSFYGSMIRSPVVSFSNFRSAMLFLLCAGIGASLTYAPLAPGISGPVR